MKTQEIRIQVIFKVDTEYGVFQDALWFTQEEYAKLTQADIDKMQQERIDNWIKIVTTLAPEPTEAEKLAQIQSEIAILSLRMQELQVQKKGLVK